MKFPLQRLGLTIIWFLSVIWRHMLHWFQVSLCFLLGFLHLHWGLYLMHLLIHRNKSV